MDSKLNCPACPKRKLTVRRIWEVEIDACTNCFGIWLDRGELDQVLQRSHRQLQSGKVMETSRSPLRCPKCSAHFTYKKSGTFEAHVCGAGIWLDGKQTAQIVKPSSTRPDPKPQTRPVVGPNPLDYIGLYDNEDWLDIIFNAIDLSRDD